MEKFSSEQKHWEFLMCDLTWWNQEQFPLFNLLMLQMPVQWCKWWITQWHVYVICKVICNLFSHIFGIEKANLMFYFRDFLHLSQTKISILMVSSHMFNSPTPKTQMHRQTIMMLTDNMNPSVSLFVHWTGVHCLHMTWARAQRTWQHFCTHLMSGFLLE